MVQRTGKRLLQKLKLFTVITKKGRDRSRGAEVMFDFLISDFEDFAFLLSF